MFFLCGIIVNLCENNTGLKHKNIDKALESDKILSDELYKLENLND